MGIGSKLDTLLKEKDISTIELARKINVAPSTIYSIIQRDNKKIDIQVLFDLSHALNVNPEYFVDNSTWDTSSVTNMSDYFVTDGDRQMLIEFKALSDYSQKRVKDYMQGLLRVEQADLELNAAHSRNDIKIDYEIDTSENHIMDDENF